MSERPMGVFVLVRGQEIHVCDYETQKAVSAVPLTDVGKEATVALASDYLRRLLEKLEIPEHLRG